MTDALKYKPELVEEFNQAVESLFRIEKQKSTHVIESEWSQENKDNIREYEFLKTPPVVQIGLVKNLCDLRCHQCWLSSLIKTKKGKPYVMDMVLYKKIIDQIAQIDEQNGSCTYLRYLGSGESLLDPELIEKVTYAKKSIKGAVTLITNGHRLHTLIPGKKITYAQGLLDSGIDLIDISIDATSDKTYQQLRGDHLHTYSMLVKNINYLIKLRDSRHYLTAISGSFLVQPENFHQAEKFKKTWGKKLDQYILRKYHSYRGHIPSKPHQINDQIGPCAAPFGRLNIMADGIVTGCYLDWTGEMIIGDFKQPQTKIQDLWQGPMKDMQKAHLSQQKPDLCKNCDGYAAAHPGVLSYEIIIRNAQIQNLKRQIQKNYDS